MEKKKSLFMVGAEYGAYFGILLSALFLLSVYATQVPVLGYVGLVLMLAVPVATVVALRKYYVIERGMSEFSALWMLGILMFFYGSLICGAVTYVWLEYVVPDFIYDQAEAAYKAYAQIPEMKGSEFVEMLKMAIDHRMLPTAIEFVFNMIMATTFMGSMISIVASLIVRIKKVK